MRFLTTLVFALVATATNATPPQYISVEDTILAENATHLFLLRTLNDNLGYHHTTQTDALLVARNLETGGDDKTWPVLRILDYGNYYADYDQAAQVENLGVAERVNPFDIVLWRGAGNILPRVMEPRELGMEVAITTDHIEIGAPREVSHRIALTEASTQINASLATTRTTMPFYFSETDSDLLLDTEMDLATNCEITGMHWYLRALEPYTHGYAAQLNCFDEDGSGGLRVWVTVPPVE